MADTSERTAATKAIYRGMDRAALDAAYNNSLAVVDSAELMARGRERSAAVRAGPGEPRCSLRQPPARTPRLFSSGQRGRRCSCSFTRLLAAQRQGHVRLRRGRTASPRIDVALVGYTLAPTYA